MLSILESWAGVLELWHENRTAVILISLSLLVVLRIYLHFDEEPEPLKTFPKVYNDAISGEKSQEPRRADVGDREDEPTQGGPRRIKGGLVGNGKLPKPPTPPEARLRAQVLVFFSSITTSTEQAAKAYLEKLRGAQFPQSADFGVTFEEPELLDISQIDLDDYFVGLPKSKGSTELFYAILIPSYNIDSFNDTFLEHLRETHHDFRIDTAPLSKLLGYSVFGLGDREGWPTEADGFCFQAKEVDRWMAKLTGGKRAYPVGMGDMKVDYAERLGEWAEGVAEVLHLVARTGSLGEGATGSGSAAESDDESLSDGDGEEVFENQAKLSARKSDDDVGDVEDLGRIIQSTQKDFSADKVAPLAVDFTTYSRSTPSKTPTAQAKEMVPKESPTYKSLTKQGYTIVGSHSGVKTCRWTKSALRGRGSCYKFSFYGIASHQCMETTPSLSCSNKCVFCWRHGTNPVGTTWRWVVDPPQDIFDGAKAGHYQKIKMLRGMPGVRAERFAEAMRIRHCALSLVGEPVFYPRINEFLALLHAERISSFLVCNAQHPDQLAALGPVTQLYVSIDASNRESLRRIDRPLHRDFWERFQRCLDIVRERRRRTRTVFRLTLVKGFNVDDEVEGYADLVARALPCFVEVKGVTFCGTSTAAGAGVRMANVPFYWEVCEFVRALDAALARRGLAYGVAAEHAHSCCALLASERFRVDGKWHTLIDYEKFFDLLEERGPDGEWTPEEYMGAETPEWATWGNGGFDPRDERVDRKGRKIIV